MTGETWVGYNYYPPRLSPTESGRDTPPCKLAGRGRGRVSISKFIMVIILWLGYQTPVKGQVRFDHIADWSNIFLSNTNLISAPVISTDDKLPGSSMENISFTSTLSFNDFYREHSRGLDRNLSSFQNRTTLRTSLILNNQVFFVGAEFGMSQKEMNYDLTESQSFRMRNAYKEYRFFLSTSIFYDYLKVSGGLGRKILENKEFNPWNLGVTFEPGNAISLSYRRFEDLFRWEYHFVFETPEVLLIADEYSQLDEFQVKINLIPELTLSAAMQNNYINKDRTADTPGTILIPGGTHYQRNIKINFFPQKQFSLNLSYYKRRNNISGYFFDSFQTFGKITEQKDHSELYESEIVYRTNFNRITFNLGWSNGMISNNGHIESWPFTPTWIDLLGVRYNFRSHLSYDLLRIGASYRYINSEWQIDVNTSFERIRPGGEARTWKPEILVFGVRDLNVNTLAPDSRDGVYIGVQVSKSFGEIFKLAYEIHQYVPLQFHNSDRQYNNAELNSNDSLMRKSIYGGGKHKVYIILNL